MLSRVTAQKPAFLVVPELPNEDTRLKNPCPASLFPKANSGHRADWRHPPGFILLLLPKPVGVVI